MTDVKKKRVVAATIVSERISCGENSFACWSKHNPWRYIAKTILSAKVINHEHRFLVNRLFDCSNDSELGTYAFVSSDESVKTARKARTVIGFYFFARIEIEHCKRIFAGAFICGNKHNPANGRSRAFFFIAVKLPFSIGLKFNYGFGVNEFRACTVDSYFKTFFNP